MKRIRQVGLWVFVSAWALLVPTLASAGIIAASGTGTGGEAISASADFELVSYDFGAGEVRALRIMLTNTSLTSSHRSNLLTGLFFSLSGGGPLTTTSDGFDGSAATVWTTNTGSTSDVDIAPAVNGSATDGTYLLANAPSAGFGTAYDGKDYSAYAYGLGTSSYGLPGFNGAATEDDNYAIAAPGSDLTLDGIPAAWPVIDTNAVFWIALPQGTTQLPTVTNAAFVFGSSPENTLYADPTTVPIPASAWLLGPGLVGLVLVRRRTRV